MKQIAHILFYILLLLCSTTGLSQNAGSKEKILPQIQVVKPLGTEKQGEAASLLEERLTQAIILNGIASTTSRFLLVTSICELSSQVTPSTPPQYVTELEVAFYIADQIEKTVLQQTTIIIKGVARTKAKAYQNAVNTIQARNPRLKTLIKKGKEKIIAYYQTQTDDSRRKETPETEQPDIEWIFNDSKL